jgi:anaerobic magnesium-protoporphyrin IX monomethyl ester cyclase
VKVLFLEIDTEQAWGVASLGPAFLAPFLRRDGHEVAMLRVPAAAPLAEVVRSIQAQAPSLLGLSLTTRQWLRARAVVQAVRAVLDVPVIAGGLHPTFAPEAVLATPGFDYVCLAEGEEPMRELVSALAQRGRMPALGIRNIWAKGGLRPALRAPFEPIDALPFVARDLLDEKYGVVNVTTQRGCPFPCTYCAARMYDELYEGTGDYGRRRSHESVLAELAEIRERGPLNYIVFLDDTFTVHHPWVRRYCELHGERVKVPFSLHARVETVNPELLAALARAGCKHIVYGVESGSERVRREILRRPVGNQRFVDVFRWTREAGINVVANYMLGVPGETRAEVEETLALHEQLAPDDFAAFVFYPYPGTHLFKVCLERGYLPDDYLELPAVHRASILRLPDLTQADVAELYDRFTALRERAALRRAGARLGEHDKQKMISDLRGAAAVG